MEITREGNNLLTSNRQSQNQKGLGNEVAHMFRNSIGVTQTFEAKWLTKTLFQG